MKEFDKDIDEKDNQASADTNNKKPLDEVTYDNTFENIQESVKANEEGLDEENENNEEKEEAAFGQGEADGREEKGNGGQDGSAEPVKQQYSSCYSPPYYVPNFTVSQPVYEKAENTNGSKSRLLVGIIAVLAVAVCLLLAAVVGLMKYVSNDKGTIIDLSNEGMSVIQNSPQIEVNKNTDEVYVPQTLPEIVSRVGNSVVEIKTSEVQSSFYGQYVNSGAGSGVLVTQSEEAGYLITNYHVIASSNPKNSAYVDEITVILNNDEEYNAVVLGGDESIDLAVLRIEKKAKEKFTVADFGDSSKLLVGQSIIAIGNPLRSLGGTVTDGIISALDRRVNIDGFNMVLLQHNAAINPGNSGGALFDMMGNLVGIVNAKSSDSGIEGLGFAIPSNIALNFLNRVMVVEPAIGIQVQYGRLDNVYGLYVVTATNSDFVKYDKIIEVNGEAIESAAQYYAIIDCLKIGDEATITVERNGEVQEIKVTLGE